MRHVDAVCDAGWSAQQNNLVDGSVLAFWNGAYSGTSSNLQYLKSGCIGANHFNNWSTANTTDTWVPVANGNKLYHRVIKPFNSDGSIPASALSICSSNRIDFGSWHIWFAEFNNSTSGWVTKDFTLPNDFKGKIKHVSCNGLWGNSGDNRLGAWINYNNGLRIRIHQGSSGSNAWSLIAFAYF